MKYIFYFFLIIASSNCISKEREYGKSIDLGYGFYEKHYSIENPPNLWKGIYNYKTIFFKERDLGSLLRFNISPSGEYAIYRKNGKREIYIFHANSEKEESILLNNFCSLKNLKWNEKEYKLHIACFGLNDSSYDIQIDLKYNKAQ